MIGIATIVRALQDHYTLPFRSGLWKTTSSHGSLAPTVNPIEQRAVSTSSSYETLRYSEPDQVTSPLAFYADIPGSMNVSW